MNGKNLKNKVTLYDCFYYFQKSEIVTGENQNYCNKCQQLTNSINATKIFSSPNILVLIIYIGKGNIFDIKLDFFEIIDISQLVLQKEQTQIIYDLYAILSLMMKVDLVRILLLLAKII